MPPEVEDAKLTKVFEVQCALNSNKPFSLLFHHHHPLLLLLLLLLFRQCFGRVTKWTRPVDPVNLIPRVSYTTPFHSDRPQYVSGALVVCILQGFGFVTFLQGICGYRCFQVLHNFLYDTEEGLAFQVKVTARSLTLIKYTTTLRKPYDIALSSNYYSPPVGFQGEVRGVSD